MSIWKRNRDLNHLLDNRKQEHKSRITLEHPKLNYQFKSFSCKYFFFKLSVTVNNAKNRKANQIDFQLNQIGSRNRDGELDFFMELLVNS